MTWRGAACLLLLVPACADQADVGRRYRAERELWNIKHEFARLAIKPELVDEGTWRALAGRYERLSTSLGQTAARGGGGARSQVAHELRVVAARALINAAQVYASLGDSAQTMASYARVVSEFQDLPQAVAEVALAQGQIAEAQRDWSRAAAAYRSVVERTAPAPDAPGAAGAVMDLPLRIARLHAMAARAASGGAAPAVPGTAPAAPDAPEVQRTYDEARERYTEWMRAHPGSRIALESRVRLADVATDLGEWQVALATLRQLESELAAAEEPAIDPASIRLGIAVVHARSQAPPESTRSTLLSLVETYSKSAQAPRALLALADQAARLGQLDEALDHLDRLQREYPEAEELGAVGMLARGRLLERAGRWREALDTFRALPVQYPVSEAALQAPLEIVDHYARAEDSVEMLAALERAERDYREFLARYPPGPMTQTARTQLVKTLVLQKHYEDAITELLALSDGPSGGQGAEFLLEAARIAQRDLGDSTRTSEILERLATRYPSTEIGRWAQSEAARLREASQ